MYISRLGYVKKSDAKIGIQGPGLIFTEFRNPIRFTRQFGETGETIRNQMLHYMERVLSSIRLIPTKRETPPSPPVLCDPRKNGTKCKSEPLLEIHTNTGPHPDCLSHTST